MDMDDKDRQQTLFKDVQEELQRLFADSFDEWIEDQINSLTQDENDEENSKKLDQFKSQ